MSDRLLELENQKNEMNVKQIAVEEQEHELENKRHVLQSLMNSHVSSVIFQKDCIQTLFTCEEICLNDFATLKDGRRGNRMCFLIDSVTW